MTFLYDLPDHRIAQRPVEGERSSSRLLYSLKDQKPADRYVRELPEILRPGDLLILNDTKVVPCRFFFPLDGKTAELFLLKELSSGEFLALGKPLQKFREGVVLDLGSGLSAEVMGQSREGVTVKLVSRERPLEDVLDEVAYMPIPPYIRGGVSDELDKDTYQTVYAKQAGSIAAPTAGLHFTESLLFELHKKGVPHTFVTLHVGAASILSVERQMSTGKVASEKYRVPGETWDAIQATKQSGGRVIAVGTTVMRALESYALKPHDDFRETDLFISDPFDFKVADMLFTNFHQPGSTHLSLVSAFHGTERVRALYQHALEGAYRFLSYGDAMLLERA